MRRIFIILMCAALMACALCPSGAVSAGESAPQTAGQNYDALKEFFRNFVGTYEKRQAGAQTERDAAEYLAAQLRERGLTSYQSYYGSGKDYFQEFDYRTNTEGRSSQNVIGVRTSAAPQGVVVIGAHYDNYADRVQDEKGNKLTGSQGAFDNGTGVSVLMELIGRTAGVSYPFDLVFGLFGAEEDGMKGSEAYVSALTEEQRAQILLYINLDSIGAGDSLYLYSDEVSTEHDGFLREAAARAGVSLANNPVNKKLMLSGFQSFPYHHIGISSDNVSFLSRGINSANFFSFAWSSGKTYLAESDSKPSVMHTAKDNYEMLKSLYGDTLFLTMGQVADLVLEALSSEGFVNAMQESAASRFDYRWMLSAKLWMGVCVVVWFLLIVAAVCGYYVLKKRIPEKPLPKYDVFGDGLDG